MFISFSKKQNDLGVGTLIWLNFEGKGFLIKEIITLNLFLLYLQGIQNVKFIKNIRHHLRS